MGMHIEEPYMRARLPASQRRPVEDIVVQQRERVQHLDGGADVSQVVLIGLVCVPAGSRVAAPDQEWPQPLPSGIDQRSNGGAQLGCRGIQIDEFACGLFHERDHQIVHMSAAQIDRGRLRARSA